MANPQTENGYTKIANEILEALCGIRIGGETRQVIDVVVRKTYGFGKKEDCISLSQFCLLTKMRRGDVCRAINKAVSMNIIKVISKNANGNGNKYCIVKDFDSWKPLAKKLRGVAKKQMTISKNAKNHKQKSYIQKKVSKETLTKDNTAETSSALIGEIIKLFEEVNPACKKMYGNTTQRKACQNLLDEYGFEEVSKVIAFLPKSNKMAYMPSIVTPCQLWEKYQVLKDGLQRKKSELSTKGRGIA